MADFVKSGYGQVEPNHLSAQRTGQIYAQLPAADAIEVLENGTFVKYDYPEGVVNFEGDGEWMLVFNEVKLYELRQFYADYAMKKADAVDGEIVPRVFKTNVGDIFTTNMVKDAAYVVGDVLAPGATGVLEDAGVDPAGMQWQVVSLTTMPDSKPAVKLMRIA